VQRPGVGAPDVVINSASIAELMSLTEARNWDWLCSWHARGDLIPASADGRTRFEVVDLREGAHLVLGFHAVWPFRCERWAGPSARVSQRATWSFVLRPAGEGATRLVVRARAVSRPRWLWAPWNAFFSVAHVPMQRKQLLGIRRRAERAPRGPEPGQATRAA